MHPARDQSIINLQWNIEVETVGEIKSLAWGLGNIEHLFNLVYCSERGLRNFSHVRHMISWVRFSIGSGKDLTPFRHQAITWPNVDSLAKRRKTIKIGYPKIKSTGPQSQLQLQHFDKDDRVPR